MPVHYQEAAQRHFEDGKMLRDQKRFGNADQLFGLAVECALKSVLLGLRAAQAEPDGTIRAPYREHVNALWRPFVMGLAGRQGAQILKRLPSPNPFSDWSVDQRYLSDQDANEERTKAYFMAAGKVMGMLHFALQERLMR